MDERYRLKPNKPNFEEVDGPLAGRKFEAGKTYADIPPGKKDWFDTVKKAAPAATSANPAQARIIRPAPAAETKAAAPEQPATPATPATPAKKERTR